MCVLYLQDQLHHLCVNQPVNRLSVDVGDQVSLSEPRLVGRTALLHVLKASREEEEEMKMCSNLSGSSVVVYCHLLSTTRSSLQLHRHPSDLNTGVMEAFVTLLEALPV